MNPTPGRSLLERRWILFVLLALVLRGLYMNMAIAELRLPDTPGLLSVKTGDTSSYLDPIESVLAGGSYQPDYRMPGVGAPYWVFRQFMDVGASRDAMVVVQWLLSGINVWLLGLLAVRLTGSDRVGVAVCALFLLSAYSSWYDASISSDSLAVSTLIVSAWFLQRAVDRRSLGLLALAGLFFAWQVFLRPVSAALLPVLAFLAFRYFPAPRRWLAAVVVLLPFAVTDALWTLRNWRAHHELNPLTNQGLMPEDLTSQVHWHVMNFIQCYGGNYIWWAPGSDMRWYGFWKGGATLDNEGRLAKAPPDHAIVPGYTRDDLFAISERIRALSAGGLSQRDSLAEANAISAELDRYAALYQEQAPFNYHVMSRVRMLRNVMWQHGTESMIMRPFGSLLLWEKIFKVVQVMFYLFAYTVGTCAVIILLWNWRKAPTALHLWLPLLVTFMVLIYPVVLRMCEWRYMVHPFPFALLLGVCLCHRVIRSRKDHVLPAEG